MFPAYAGMIPPEEFKRDFEVDVPRIRGDDPDAN